ncbi:MAG: hypothetical protein H6730_17755 [Deltaproteobacteria bacterium]|nr:hypothetical protein [Deltaproteobacteria bacterium]
MSMLLSSAELHPASLPPSAIVVARRLRVKAPRGFGLDRLRPPPTQWTAALERDFARLCSVAKRPVDGRLPADAEVVVFQDEAELLTCWARALLERTSDRWYWVTLFGPPPGSLDAWASAAVARPTAIAPALAELATAGLAPALVEGLSTAAVLRTIHAMATVSGRPRWIAIAQALTHVPVASTPPARSDAPAGSVDSAPWPLLWVAPASMSAERVLLVGLAVTLVHPSAFKDIGQAEAVLERWAVGLVSRLDGPGADATRGLELASGPVGTAVAPGASVGRRPDERPDIASAMHSPPGSPTTACDPNTRPAWPQPSTADQRDAERPQADRTPARTAAGSSHRLPSHDVADAPARDGTRGLMTRSASTANAELVVAAAPTGPASTSAAPTEPRRPTPDEHPGAAPSTPPVVFDDAGTATRLGGVFYLLNALTAISVEEAPVTPWATLELHALGLLCGLGETWRLDPVWAVLAALDGREPHAPIERRGPASRPGVLRVEDAPWLQAPVEPLRGYGLSNLEPALLTWLSWSVLRLHDRLQTATGLEGPAELLVRPCQVFVTRTHVDIVDRIDRASLVARRAGLDRDPGWRPEFQRVVQFFFV